MSTMSAKNIQAIIAKANDLNYFGKRLATAKNAVAETISKELFQTGSRSQEVKAIIENNRPVKAAKAKVERAAKEDTRPLAAGVLNSSVDSWEVIKGKRFILTSSQNNTFPHDNFFKALQVYAKHINATLLVSRFIYNKNKFQNGEGNEDVKFDKAFDDHVITNNVFLNSKESGFAFMAALNILPTATYPLSGFAETATAYGLKGMALGHAKISAESVPALKGEVVRRLYSTGTATLKNYIQQKAGQKAEALHNFGALIVEFDDSGEFFVRQLESMDSSGSFYDLDCHITTEGVTEGNRILALQYGDIHAEKIDAHCAQASWGEGGLVDVLKPKYQIVHDVHDFTSRNHHNRMSGTFLAEQYAAGRDKVLDDLIDTGAILEDMDRPYSQTMVVESNHDLALSRWLNDPKANITQDPANARLFHTLNAAIYTAIEEKDSSFNVLDYALRNVANCDFAAVFLTTDESFKLADIEMGCHGHNGINGSRGNPKQFMKLGKMNTGHTHTPSIFGGVYTAGVSGSLDMGYNIGASSWSQTHIITYPNGQRTLIDFKNGKFYA